jgi:DNA-binding beta-propeller fold protein YncE
MCSDNRVPPSQRSAFAAKISALVVAVLAFFASAGCGGATNTVNSTSNGTGGDPVAAKVSGTIAAGTNPAAIAVDSTTNKIYVADFGKGQNNGQCQTCFCPLQNGTLTVIDGATQKSTTTPF